MSLILYAALGADGRASARLLAGVASCTNGSYLISVGCRLGLFSDEKRFGKIRASGWIFHISS